MPGQPPSLAQMLRGKRTEDGALTYRMSMLPFGTYRGDDGSDHLGFAWPGAVTEPLAALSRLAESSRFEDGRLGIPNPANIENQSDTRLLLETLLGGNSINPGAVLPKNAVGMFAGRRAATADLDALARAQTMDQFATPREAIWNQTGWFKGKDGQWRHEISDHNSDWIEAFPADMAPGTNTHTNVAGAIDHPDVAAAYPDLMDRPVQYVRVKGAQPGSRGLYVPSKDAIAVVADPARDPKSTMLHEMQHGIQQREGFAPGASPSSFTPDQIAMERARLLSQPESGNGWESVGNISGDIPDSAVAHHLYWRNAGEAEARNVQRRMNMTPEDRKATPPWLTQDVPDELQFYSDNLPSLFGAGAQSSDRVQPSLATALKYQTY